jgi:arginine exporter protein ArgO
MLAERYNRAVLLAADETVLDNASDGVLISCSVAGVAVLIMESGSTVAVQLVVGATRLPFAIRGYTATGSSGTFSVNALYSD